MVHSQDDDHDETVSLAALKAVYHLSSKEAAEHLGVSMSRLKKSCKVHSVGRWPHRKLASLVNLKEAIESENASLVDKQKVLALIESEHAKVMEFPDHQVDTTLDDMRQARYKLRYYHRNKHVQRGNNNDKNANGGANGNGSANGGNGMVDQSSTRQRRQMTQAEAIASGAAPFNFGAPLANLPPLVLPNLGPLPPSHGNDSSLTRAMSEGDGNGCGGNTGTGGGSSADAHSNSGCSSPAVGSGMGGGLTPMGGMGTPMRGGSTPLAGGLLTPNGHAGGGFGSGITGSARLLQTLMQSPGGQQGGTHSSYVTSGSPRTPVTPGNFHRSSGLPSTLPSTPAGTNMQQQLQQQVTANLFGNGTSSNGGMGHFPAKIQFSSAIVRSGATPNNRASSPPHAPPPISTAGPRPHLAPPGLLTEEYSGQQASDNWEASVMQPSAVRTAYHSFSHDQPSNGTVELRDRESGGCSFTPLLNHLRVASYSALDQVAAAGARPWQRTASLDGYAADVHATTLHYHHHYPQPGYAHIPPPQAPSSRACMSAPQHVHASGTAMPSTPPVVPSHAYSLAAAAAVAAAEAGRTPDVPIMLKSEQMNMQGSPLRTEPSSGTPSTLIAFGSGLFGRPPLPPAQQLQQASGSVQAPMHHVSHQGQRTERRMSRADDPFAGLAEGSGSHPQPLQLNRAESGSDNNGALSRSTSAAVAAAAMRANDPFAAAAARASAELYGHAGGGGTPPPFGSWSPAPYSMRSPLATVTSGHAPSVYEPLSLHGLAEPTQLWHLDKRSRSTSASGVPGMPHAPGYAGGVRGSLSGAHDLTSLSVPPSGYASFTEGTAGSYAGHGWHLRPIASQPQLQQMHCYQMEQPMTANSAGAAAAAAGHGDQHMTDSQLHSDTSPSAADITAGTTPQQHAPIRPPRASMHGGEVRLGPSSQGIWRASTGGNFIQPPARMSFQTRAGSPSPWEPDLSTGQLHHLQQVQQLHDTEHMRYQDAHLRQQLASQQHHAQQQQQLAAQHAHQQRQQREVELAWQQQQQQAAQQQRQAQQAQAQRTQADQEFQDWEAQQLQQFQHNQTQANLFSLWTSDSYDGSTEQETTQGAKHDGHGHGQHHAQQQHV